MTWCLQIAAGSVIIGSIRQQKEGYSYALYNHFSWKESIKVVHNQPEAPEEEAKKTSAEDSSSVSDSQEPSETPAP